MTEEQLRTIQLELQAQRNEGRGPMLNTRIMFSLEILSVLCFYESHNRNKKQNSLVVQALFPVGGNTAQLIADKLNVPFLGCQGFYEQIFLGQELLPFFLETLDLQG